MFGSQKHAFWQALLVTVVIFAAGILFGIILENWRNSQVDILYRMSEIDLLDVNIQNEIYSMGKFNCDKAIQENILFADRIYGEGKLLERYQKASVLKTEEVVIQHKKYDLLRTILLLNSIKIKEKCNVSYHDVVYFYKYHTADLDLIAKETVFSKLLGELKEQKGNSILLIPIAADTNVTSTKLVLDRYNISKDDLPIILIDGKTRVSELQKVEDLQKYFKN